MYKFLLVLYSFYNIKLWNTQSIIPSPDVYQASLVLTFASSWHNFLSFPPQAPRTNKLLILSRLYFPPLPLIHDKRQCAGGMGKERKHFFLFLFTIDNIPSMSAFALVSYYN